METRVKMLFFNLLFFQPFDYDFITNTYLYHIADSSAIIDYLTNYVTDAIYLYIIVTTYNIPVLLYSKK